MHHWSVGKAVLGFGPDQIGTLVSGTIWASTRENLSLMFANNTGADQPAHPRSLISAFVIAFWEVRGSSNKE